MKRKNEMTQHAQERALERYNINLSKRDEYAIIEQIRNNAHTPLNLPTTGNNRKFAYVVYKNIPLKVLYERANKGGVKQIITVYPFDAEEYNKVMQLQFDSKIDLAIQFLKKNKYIVYKRKGKNSSK